MMTSISGERGVGKTYELSKETYERFKKGQFIITNFSHVYSNIDGSGYSTDEFIELLIQLLQFRDNGYNLKNLFPAFNSNAVFIGIDEGHLYFSADSFKKYQTDEKMLDVIKLLAQARKQDIDIFYTTQDPSKIDKNWRRYTDNWVRFRPFFGLSIKKSKKNKDGIINRELRYLLPLFWKEVHQLDYSNPVFDYSVVKDDEGVPHLSKQSTLKYRNLVCSGWLNSFPYRLYDSNQVLAVRRKSFASEYPLLLDSFAYVKHTFKPERYPTIKKLFGMKLNDSELPIRYKFNDLVITENNKKDPKNILCQPLEFLDMIKFFNEKKKARFDFVKRALETKRTKTSSCLELQINVVP